MEILSDGEPSEKNFPVKKPLPPIVGGGGDNNRSVSPSSTDDSDGDGSNSRTSDKYDENRSSRGNKTC